MSYFISFLNLFLLYFIIATIIIIIVVIIKINIKIASDDDVIGEIHYQKYLSNQYYCSHFQSCF